MWNIFERAVYVGVYAFVLYQTQKNMKKLGIKYNEYKFINYYGLDGEEQFLIPEYV